MKKFIKALGWLIALGGLAPASISACWAFSASSAASAWRSCAANAAWSITATQTPGFGITVPRSIGVPSGRRSRSSRPLTFAIRRTSAIG